MRYPSESRTTRTVGTVAVAAALLLLTENGLHASADGEDRDDNDATVLQVRYHGIACRDEPIQGARRFVFGRCGIGKIYNVRTDKRRGHHVATKIVLVSRDRAVDTDEIVM